LDGSARSVSSAGRHVARKRDERRAVHALPSRPDRRERLARNSLTSEVIDFAFRSSYDGDSCIDNPRRTDMAVITANDGTQLSWREWGSGAPMLFVSAMACGSTMWDYQFAEFGERGMHCLSLDRRGHGRSDQSAGGYDFDTFADDLATLIDTLDLKEITLVSHSMGSGDIVRYLSRHGSRRVARVIMLSPTTPMLLRSEDNPAGMPREAFEALWALWRRDYPSWVASAVAPFFIPETSPAMMQWGTTSLLQASVPVALACSRALVEADFRQEMRRIDVPTLIIHGDRDRSVPVEVGGLPSSELIPGSVLKIYPGAPHGLLYTHMDQLHADMLDFLRA
jgi:pimeloyl-ACP methyl ester carboxylesterase